MAIAKRPGNQNKPTVPAQDEKKIEEFISSTPGQPTSPAPAQVDKPQPENKKGVMIYVEPGLLDRADKAARKHGLSRSGFFNYAVSKFLENEKE